MITLEEAEWSNSFNHAIHLIGKPLVVIVLKRNSHSIVSKAFEKSILRKMAWFLVLDMCCSNSLVELKFSVICLPLIKAVWFLEIRVGILPLRRFARILDKTLGTAFKMLIGL